MFFHKCFWRSHRLGKSGQFRAVGLLMCLSLFFFGGKVWGETWLPPKPRVDHFLVGGHLYDAPALLTHLDRINADSADLFFSCGDLMSSSGHAPARNHALAFSAKLIPPLYNAPGNHDVIDREQYRQHFGNFTHRFTRGKDLYLVLDSEDIAETGGKAQFEELQNYLTALTDWPAIQNIFIFSHRLLWAQDRPEFQEAAERANVGVGLYFEDQFTGPFREWLLENAEGKQVYWFAGDVGTPWSYPLFYDTDPLHPHFHYLATGLGNDTEESLIKVSIDTTGVVTLAPFPLGDHEVVPLENYNREWLHERFADQPPPYLGRFSDKQRVKWGNASFRQGLWVGLIVGIGFMAGVAGILLYRKKKKYKT